MLRILTRLQECEQHQLPLEYYFEEEIPDDSKFEFASVIYGCQKCTHEKSDISYTKIDKENLLNVYQLRQELFKEKQTSISAINSLLTYQNIEVLDKIPQLQRQEQG